MLYYLMNADIPVLIYDLDDRYISVLNNDMLPYALKDYIKTTDLSSKNSIQRSMHHMDVLKDFLCSRVLQMDRVNAKAILSSTGLPRSPGTRNLLKIAHTNTDVDSLIYDPTGLTFQKTIGRYAGYAGEIAMDENTLPEPCRRRYDRIKNIK